MEEDVISLKDDSSFEVLSSSDEEDFFTAMQSSTLNGSFFSNVNSSFSLKSMVEEGEDENPDTNSNTIRNRAFSVSSDDLRPYFEQPMESLQNSDSALNKALECESASELPSGDNTSFNAKCGINSRTAKNGAATGVETPTFEIMEETANGYQKIGKVENYLPLVGGSENTVVQLYPDRNNCPKKLCSVVKHSLKMYRWLRSNKCLQNLIAGAKSSFHNILNTFELEMNLMTGMGDPLNVLIIADASDSMVIEESFCQSLSGQVVLSRCPEVVDTTIPALPVGYNSALQVAQSKIHNARQLHDSERNTVMVSTSNFIAEIYPQRWQMSTVLCLEDPNLALNLHNFTSTIPVPNEYTQRAQRLTPENYPLKELGLAVTLDQAIGYATKADSKDTHEILCGINHLVNLKSAADVLAGMYNKYVNRFS